MADKELEGQLTDYFVTETIFNGGSSIAELEEFLKARRTTGKITVERNMSQGGSQIVKVTERTRVSGTQSERIRAFLGWH